MPNASPHIDLQTAAADSMRAHGFEPEFSPQVLSEVAALEAHPPPVGPGEGIRDLRQLLWSSIDNDTSRDLDQLEVAERLPDGATRVQVAIADVDAFVRQAVGHRRRTRRSATTTVYTGVRNFPMLPEALSTRATSLLEAQDNLSVVIEFVVAPDGAVRSSDVYRAVVRNTAQLTYDGVGAWLERAARRRAKVAASSDAAGPAARSRTRRAQALRQARYRHGALNIETIETRPVVLHGQVVDVVRQDKNRATELIEDFMIAANEVVARMLEAQARVVDPARGQDARALGSHRRSRARRSGARCRPRRIPKALNEFLIARKAADPDHFADLSLAVIKLMGPANTCSSGPAIREPGTSGWPWRTTRIPRRPTAASRISSRSGWSRRCLPASPRRTRDDELARDRAATARSRKTPRERSSARCPSASRPSR